MSLDWSYAIALLRLMERLFGFDEYSMRAQAQRGSAIGVPAQDERNISGSGAGESANRQRGARDEIVSHRSSPGQLHVRESPGGRLWWKQGTGPAHQAAGVSEIPWHSLHGMRLSVPPPAWPRLA